MTNNKRECVSVTDNKRQLRRIMGELVGAASTCWENPRGAGVFQSNEASGFLDGAVEEIDALFLSHPQCLPDQEGRVSVTDNKRQLRQIMGELVGAASMCWEDPRGAGVFQLNQASSFLDAAVEEIEALFLSYSEWLYGQGYMKGRSHQPYDRAYYKWLAQDFLVGKS